MIRYDHYTDKFVKVSDKECPWCKAVCASTDKYCHECGWHIASISQTDCDTCRHYKLACELFSEVCKYEPTTQNSNLTFETDTPQTEKDKVVCPNCGRSDYIRSFEKDFNIKNSEYRYKCINCNTYIKDTPHTESTGSPIGDYRDGVGSWQTDCFDTCKHAYSEVCDECYESNKYNAMKGADDEN